MFTGIVEAQGRVLRLERGKKKSVLCVCPPARVAAALSQGESLAVNGVCLTVRERHSGDIFCDLLDETLRATNLGWLAAGARVNLERSLRWGGRMGGHFLTGHVDATAEILYARKKGRDTILRIACPPEYGKFLIPKGSVAVDGVSLTVVDIASDAFSVHLIPHTLRATTLGRVATGIHVNLEFDIMAKYLWQWMRRSGRR